MASGTNSESSSGVGAAGRADAGFGVGADFVKKLEIDCCFFTCDEAGGWEFLEGAIARVAGPSK